MSTAVAMLDAIAASPADTTARLAYADWLEEFGAEADWHAYLDANPDHHEVRARFGAWLEERGDKRGEGYRALAALQKSPQRVVMNEDLPDARHDEQWVLGRSDNLGDDSEAWQRKNGICQLPLDWFKILPRTHRAYSSARWDELWRNWEHFGSRQEAEDAAAIAFAKLPEPRRAELLAGVRA